MHFTAPFLAVLATLGATVQAQRAVCNRQQYADVARQIQNPAYFCKFYLAQPRKSSPLPKYGARSLTQLCKCFVQNSPRVRGPFKPLRPNPAPKTCPINLYRALKNQYKDPVAFCRWYTSIPRELSPLPSQNNPNTVVKACRCYLNKQFPPQQTTATTPPATTASEEPTSTNEPVPTSTTARVSSSVTTTRTTETTTTRVTLLPVPTTSTTTSVTTASPSSVATSSAAAVTSASLASASSASATSAAITSASEASASSASITSAAITSASEASASSASASSTA